MFKKILVAVDKTENSRQAFNQGLSLAQHLGAQLRLFHVLNFNDPESPDRLLLYSSSVQLNEKLMKQYEQDWNEFVAAYGEYLRALVQEATAQGVEASCCQAYGSAGPVICDVADTWDADLVVLGCRQRSGLKELLLGSVSNYVMHHAPCAVMVVHSQPIISQDIRTQKTTVLSA